MQHLKLKTGFILSLFVLLAACQSSVKNEASSTLAVDAEARSAAGSGDASPALSPEGGVAGASVAKP